MLPYAIAWVQDQVDNEVEGQGLVEYAMIILLVSLLCMATLRIFGTQVSAMFAKVVGLIAAG